MKYSLIFCSEWLHVLDTQLNPEPASYFICSFIYIFEPQDDKSFSILRKTLGSFLDNASDEDFTIDE